MSVARDSERGSEVTCPRPHSKSIVKFCTTPRSPERDLSSTTNREMGQKCHSEHSAERALEIACHLPWRLGLSLQSRCSLLLLLMGVAPLPLSAVSPFPAVRHCAGGGAPYHLFVQRLSGWLLKGPRVARTWALGGAGILWLVMQQGDTRRETFILVWPPWWVQDDVKQALFKKSQIWSDLGFQVFGISRQNCSGNFWNPGDICGPEMLGGIFFFIIISLSNWMAFTEHMPEVLEGGPATSMV